MNLAMNGYSRQSLSEKPLIKASFVKENKTALFAKTLRGCKPLGQERGFSKILTIKRQADQELAAKDREGYRPLLAMRSREFEACTTFTALWR